MEDAPTTIRDHLKLFGTFDQAKALRGDERAAVDFIAKKLPDGPAAFFRGYVSAIGWTETAKRIFD